MDVNYYDYVKTTQSGGVTISKLKVTPAPLRKNVQRSATLEHHSFIPYNYIVRVRQFVLYVLLSATKFFFLNRLANYLRMKFFTLWLAYLWKTLACTL